MKKCKLLNNKQYTHNKHYVVYPRPTCIRPTR